jgi:hypothetical protein
MKLGRETATGRSSPLLLGLFEPRLCNRLARSSSFIVGELEWSYLTKAGDIRQPRIQAYLACGNLAAGGFADECKDRKELARR